MSDRDETPDVLTEARELLAGITPGPWRHVTGEGHAVKVSSESGPVAEIWPRFSGDVPAATDAEFIAAAPRLVRDLLAEVDRLRRAGETLGKVIDVQCLSALRAIGQDLGGDLIDADGDGDWAVVWDLLAELLPDRDAALAKVERLRGKALAERDEALAAIGRVRALAEDPPRLRAAYFTTPAGSRLNCADANAWLRVSGEIRHALDGGEQ